MKYINLYNPDLRRRVDVLEPRWVGLALLLVVVLLLVASLYSTFKAADVSAQLERAEQQLKNEKGSLAQTLERLKQGPSPVLVQELAATKQQLEVRKEVLALLQSGKLGVDKGFSEYFKGFSRLTMEGLWLTGLDIDAGGSEMEIRGRMMNQALLPEYLRRLNRESTFQGRAFAALDMAGVDEDAQAAKQPGSQPVAKAAAGMGTPVRYVEFVLRSREVSPPLQKEGQ